MTCPSISVEHLTRADCVNEVNDREISTEEESGDQRMPLSKHAFKSTNTTASSARAAFRDPMQTHLRYV